MSDSTKTFEDKDGEIMIQRVPERTVEISSKMIRKIIFGRECSRKPGKAIKYESYFFGKLLRWSKQKYSGRSLFRAS